MATREPTPRTEDLRPAEFRGAGSPHIQLRALGITPRWRLIRCGNNSVDWLNRRGWFDIPVLVVVTFSLFVVIGFAGPRLASWIGNFIDGWNAENKVQSADDEHGREIAAIGVTVEVTVATRATDRQRPADASVPDDLPTGVASPVAVAFDLNWAKAVFLLCALLIGFSRWHHKSRQDTLSHAFERKKAVNDFIIVHCKTLAEMISAATNPVDMDDPLEPITPDQCKAHLAVIGNPISGQTTVPSRPYDNISAEKQFIQKMFIFFELDNLEFAFNKHIANLLDDTQMVRACQIFESRCLGARFRYLALLLGKNNYDPDFLRLAQDLVIIGYVRSGAAPPGNQA